jgi:hypothetical protein
VAEVRAQLAGLDGLLVWVNPIQDGANRKNVDGLLREASNRGTFVSAEPAVIMKMGTKEVLYVTRELGWGSNTDLYHSPAELVERIPARLASHRRLVVKQGRGNGGNGVWKVELDQTGTVTRDSQVRLQDARNRDDTSEHQPLGEFLDRCAEYFEWSGVLIDQPFQQRLADGMLRCYFSHGQVIGFSHQWPRGLLDLDPAASPSKPESDRCRVPTFPPTKGCVDSPRRTGCPKWPRSSVSSSAPCRSGTSAKLQRESHPGAPSCLRVGPGAAGS